MADNAVMNDPMDNGGRPEKVRMSNFELLRIAAMFMIIAHHFAVHGGFEFPADTLTVNRFWIQIMRFGGKVGVDIFVLISGYFLIKSNSERLIQKTLKLSLQIWFYSAVIFILFTTLKLEPLSLKGLAKTVFPISYSRWWFASTYLVLFIISPYLNKLLLSLTRAEYIRFLALNIVIWCILSTILHTAWEADDLVWFIILYAAAAYIRLPVEIDRIDPKKLIILAVVMFILTMSLTLIYEFAGRGEPWFYEQNHIPVFVISVTLFLLFSKLKMKHNRFVNLISQTTFGIYLIHDDRSVRSFLWKTLFKNASYAESGLLIPYSIICVIVVFAACSCIELVRIYALEKRYSGLLDAASERIKKLTDKIFELPVFQKYIH